MDHNRDAPWMCARCGYMMDANSASSGKNVAPVDGDVALCLNCAAVYWRESSKWRPIKPAEWDSIEPEIRRELALMTIVQRMVITEDLAKEHGGRT